MTSDPIARYLAGRGAKLGRRERLRLMASGEVLDSGLRTYRYLGLTFLRLTVVPSLFCLTSLAFVLDYVAPSLAETHHAASITGQLQEVVASLCLAVFVGGPLFILGMSYTSALVVRLTSDFMLGNAIQPGEATSQAVRLLPTLMRVTFRELMLSISGLAGSTIVLMLGALLSQYTPTDETTSGLLGLIGIFGLVLGGGVFLYVVTTHALAPAVAVLEGLGPKESALRSNYLLKGQPGQISGASRLWGVYLFMMFVGVIEWTGFTALFSLVDIGAHVENAFAWFSLRGVVVTAFELAPTFVVLWTVLPIWAACVTIVYYERRIRLEGYDIEALAHEIGSGRTSRFDV